ncbi:MAG: nucleotidyltransferase family protein, partial [Atribacterota bacterium]|nr:nucleotidyltransferase family protein [Atribacterota bacterium]
NNNGKKILKKIKNNSKIPVIIKFASFIKNNKDPVLCKMINYDILSTKLYTLAYQLENKRFAGKDFTSKPIILEN